MQEKALHVLHERPLLQDLTDKSGVDLGKYFGNISGAGITVRYNHLAKQIQFNRRLKGRIKRIKNTIVIDLRQSRRLEICEPLKAD